MEIVDQLTLMLNLEIMIKIEIKVTLKLAHLISTDSTISPSYSLYFIPLFTDDSRFF